MKRKKLTTDENSNPAEGAQFSQKLPTIRIPEIQQKPEVEPSPLPENRASFCYQHVYRNLPTKADFNREKDQTTFTVVAGFALKGIVFPPEDLARTVPRYIAKSIAYQTLEINFAELEKNWLDAGVTEALLTITETPNNMVKICIEDNGSGFSSSLFNTLEPNHEMSYKKILETESGKLARHIPSEKYAHRHEQYGGAGRALANNYLRLNRCGGDLFICNISNHRSPSGVSARITWISPLRAVLRPEFSPLTDIIEPLPLHRTNYKLATSLKSSEDEAQENLAPEKRNKGLK